MFASTGCISNQSTRMSCEPETRQSSSIQDIGEAAESGRKWRQPLPLGTLRSDRPNSLKRTILLIEKIQLVREGLVEILREHCPEYQIRIQDGALPAATNESDPDLIVMSIRDGFWTPHAAAGRSARSIWPYNSPILLISENDDPDQALQALRAGFAGFFPATQPAEMLIAAVRLVLAGGRFCPPSLIATQLADPVTTAGGQPIQGNGSNGKRGRGISNGFDRAEARTSPDGGFGRRTVASA